MMQQSTATNWQARLATALRQDPAKTGVLGVLVAILLAVSARAMLGTSSPSAAAGVPVALVNGAPPVSVSLPAPKPGSAAASLRGWLSVPIPTIARNDFIVKSEYFPQDIAKKSDASAQSGFWTALEKSLSLQADQKEKREAQIARLKQQAADLKPTSTVMGSSPRAMINGTLVAEGETVDSFRVLRIESRGILVEREGIQLAIPMK